MAEYLFDRDAALADIDEIIGDNAGFKAWAIRAYIEQSPCIEIIRCRDCYYCETVKSFDKIYYYCDCIWEHAEGDLIGVSLQVNPDHYCSWAERRREE